MAIGAVVFSCLGGLPATAAGENFAILDGPPAFDDEIGPQTVLENELLSFTVEAADPDDDPITFGFSFGTYGLTLTPTGPETAEIAFTPDCAQAGEYTLMLTATANEQADTLYATITVVNANCPPAFASVVPQQVNEGDTLSFVVTAGDPDGDSLILTQVTTLVHSAFVDSGNGVGVFTFMPGYDQDSVYQVKFSARDTAITVELTVQVTVINVNAPPQLAPLADQSVRIESTLTFAVSATDPDGTTPVLLARPLPPTAAFIDDGDGTGQFTMTPVGDAPISYQVWFIATDGQAADSIMVTITVLEKPPVFGPDTLFVAKTGADTLGAGSRIAPYKTIQYAMDHSDTGYVVAVFPGEYNEAVAFDIWPVELRSLFGADSATINGHGKGTPVTFPPLPGGLPGTDELSSILDGFTVTCPSCAGVQRGGVTIAGGAPIVRNNKVINNELDTVSTPSLGGGMYLISSSPVIYNNIIAGNVAMAGAGIYIDDNARPTMVNNTIADNISSHSNAGAGIHIFSGGGLDFKNGIIAANRTGWGIYSESMSARVSFTLFHGNDAGAYTPSGVTIGEGHFTENPGFADAAAGDYHLICRAGAFNKGTFAAIDTLCKTDLEGNPRTAYLQPDLGALEFLDNDKHADFTASDTAGCDYLMVKFTNTSTCIDEFWSWDFGDGLTSTVKSPTHDYISPGIYTVRLIARGDLDADTLVRTGYIRIYEDLAADFHTDSLVGCVPFSVPFSSEITGLAQQYLWDFGDGTTSSNPSPTHVYNSPGKRTVTLTVSNPCDMVVVTKEDLVWTQAAPVVAITSSHDADSTISGPLCNPLTVRFYTVSSDSIISYSWDFADNTTSTERNPVHVYQSAGTYSVRLITTGMCGSTTTVRQAYITVQPRPTITPHADKTTGCVPLTVNFTVSSSGAVTSYRWLFGDGAVANGPAVSHTYSSIDTFKVQLIAAHECGTDTIPLSVPVVGQGRPQVSFTCPGGDTYVGDSIHFTDQSSNLPSTWSWDFGDGEISTLANPVHVYWQAGIYTVSLTAGNSCGVGTQIQKNACVTVGTYEVEIGPPSVVGDTIFYPLDIDTVLTDYPHEVYFKARVLPSPERGTLSAIFLDSSGVPPFSTRLGLIPSRDLSSELYTVSVSAVDSALGYQVTETLVYNHHGRTFLALQPDTLDFDSVVVNRTRYVPVHILNTSATELLTVESVTAEGEGFSAPTVEGVAILPDSSISFSVGFRPRKRLTYTGTLKIITDDPVVRDTMIVLIGRGIPEQDAPTITATYPAAGTGDVLISDSVILEFSEPVQVDYSDTTIIISSRRLGWRLEGTWEADEQSVTFFGNDYWPQLDTLDVRLVAERAYDSVHNTVDGDGDGVEEGSPEDDYLFSFYTGPGVFPGDTDDDGAVDERDVLPLGRYWLQTGPPRPSPYVDFAVQPAHSWIDVHATYADADGDGKVDSLDVCPILEFWTAASQDKPAQQQRMLQRLADADLGILRAIYGAIDYCPETAASATLKAILFGWLEQANGGPPDEFALQQNYPNPFNAQTMITYVLPEAADVELAVFNVRGAKVAVISAGRQSSGRHVAVWDGQNFNGEPAASGMYFYRLLAGEFRQTRKMVLLK